MGSMQPSDYEKLGQFYLGREYDLEKKSSADKNLVLYDSKDLVTHAIVVGMTGSGKTGLCIDLIEEAAIDGVPAIAIDPKGDLTNLLLTFPDLRPEDFRPWINEDDAARKGLSPDDFAKQQAELWRNGLASWGEDGERIRRLKAAADFAIYTPGSTAGIPVSIVRSFAAPPAALREDAELFRERVATTTTSLLALVGIAADPVKSREHILLSTLFTAAWTAGQDLDLTALVNQVQKPPMGRIGALDLEKFYPAKDRDELALRINGLIAAPGFAGWLEGEPLDVGAFFRSSAGKPRVSVFSIAHLSDAERMFFVALLLNEIYGWIRTQSGTTSLRAILYMDEIVGFFSARRRTAIEAAHAQPTQTGAGLRTRRRARDAEPGGPGLQGARKHRHVVSWSAPDRSRQAACPRWTRGRRRGSECLVRSEVDGGASRRTNDSRVPHE
jgi:hypothetical protein